jgi:hypothetical protein
MGKKRSVVYGLGTTRSPHWGQWSKPVGIKESRLGHGSSPEEECSTSDSSTIHCLGSAMHIPQGSRCYALASFRGQ